MNTIVNTVAIFIWRAIVGYSVGAITISFLVRILQSLTLETELVILLLIPIFILAIFFCIKRMTRMWYFGIAVMILMIIVILSQHNEISETFLGHLLLLGYIIFYYAGCIFAAQCFVSKNPQINQNNM